MSNDSSAAAAPPEGASPRPASEDAVRSSGEDAASRDDDPAHDPAARASSPRDPSTSSPDRGDDPRSSAQQGVLPLAWPFALIAVFSVILGRAVGPSMAGIGVGMDQVIHVVELAGKVVSQLFAMAAVVLAMAAILHASRIRLPSAVRLGAIGLGGAVILVNLLASPRREGLPSSMILLMALAAAVLALLAAQSALRVPYARAAGLIIGLIAVAALVRLAAIALSGQAAGPSASTLTWAARAVATGAVGVEILAVLLATAWVSTRSARGLKSPVTLIAFALALFLTRQAMRGGLEDAGPVNLLIHRAAEHFLSRPDPILPAALSVFLAMVSPLMALAALLVPAGAGPQEGAPGTSSGPSGSTPALRAPPVPPAIRASIALALLVRGAPEAPLGGILLAIAALFLALGARDDRGVWDAIRATSRGAGKA